MISIKYVIRRLLFFFSSAFAAITLNFILPRMMPGNPIDVFVQMLRRQGRSAAEAMEIAEIYKRKFGLEGDLWTQYVSYLRNLLAGDLGPSIMSYPRSVLDLINESIPRTLALFTTATIISFLLGICFGTLVCFLPKDSKISNFITSLSLCLNAIPFYIFALIFSLLFAYLIPIFPPYGMVSYGVKPEDGIRYFLDLMWHAMLPSLSMIVVSVGGWLIFTRSLLIQILGEDYLVFAEAKGLKRSTILFKYQLKNALPPITTNLALTLGFMIGGNLLVETIFSWPGMGYLLQKAIATFDYNTMQGTFLVTTIVVLLATLLIDLILPFIDPRVGVE